MVGGLARLKDGQLHGVFARSTDSRTTGFPRCTGDRSGNVWLGTFGGGLLRFKNGKFNCDHLAQRPAGQLRLGVRETRDGSLWVGTNGGLTGSPATPS